MYKIISWNINGIRASIKKGFLDKLENLDADVFAVQEIKAMPEQIPETVSNHKKYKVYWNSAERKGYSGVGTFTKIEPQNVIYGINSPEHDVEGRTLTLEFDDYYVVNNYFPNSQSDLQRIDYKLNYNNNLKKFLDSLNQNKSIIVTGDFNVAHKPIDLTNPELNEGSPGYSEPERNWMEKFLNNGYMDTFRKFNNEPEHYTWWSYMRGARFKNIGWRIDYFCIDNKSENRIINSYILPEIMGSDHCPIGFEFE